MSSGENEKRTEQAGAELCQAQGKFRRVRLALDLYLIWLMN